jgi:hypothetical protein
MIVAQIKGSNPTLGGEQMAKKIYCTVAYFQFWYFYKYNWEGTQTFLPVLKEVDTRKSKTFQPSSQISKRHSRLETDESKV